MSIQRQLHMMNLLLKKLCLKRAHASQVCRRCNQEKPAAEFYKNRLMLDGLYSHCKACYQAAASVSCRANSPSFMCQGACILSPYQRSHLRCLGLKVTSSNFAYSCLPTSRHPCLPVHTH